MKRWMTTQQLANEIAEMDVADGKELNISQCNSIAKNVKNLYKFGGKNEVINHLNETLTMREYSMDQKQRLDSIMKKLFRWHFLPWSRIRNNMERLCA